FWLGPRPGFALKPMQIEPLPGQTVKHVNLPLVKSQVLDKVQGNFFTVRLEDIKHAFEAMPWVRHASVRRVWPNGLAVSIEEQKPLGIWGSRDDQKLINGYGEVFSGNVADADDGLSLVEFTGPEDSNKEVVQLYRKASRWFSPWNVEVASVNLSDRYSWNIKLSNGMRIEFGRDEEAQGKALTEERVARLIQYWPQVQERWTNRVDAIDLRYGNGFAVHLASTSHKAAELEIKKGSTKR
ncbi:MAG: cell division protein FtsQ/DivIB, partial [Polynucleobacter sp.]|nr:cell division protein FtsQ/DivIB [Polynucleobacter sp.]